VVEHALSPYRGDGSTFSSASVKSSPFLVSRRSSTPSRFCLRMTVQLVLLCLGGRARPLAFFVRMTVQLFTVSRWSSTPSRLLGVMVQLSLLCLRWSTNLQPVFGDCQIFKSSLQRMSNLQSTIFKSPKIISPCSSLDQTWVTTPTSLSSDSQSVYIIGRN
jgi:hypothetical protein